MELLPAGAFVQEGPSTSMGNIDLVSHGVQGLPRPPLQWHTPESKPRGDAPLDAMTLCGGDVHRPGLGHKFITEIKWGPEQPLYTCSICQNFVSDASVMRGHLQSLYHHRQYFLREYSVRLRYLHEQVYESRLESQALGEERLAGSVEDPEQYALLLPQRVAGMNPVESDWWDLRAIPADPPLRQLALMPRLPLPFDPFLKSETGGVEPSGPFRPPLPMLDHIRDEFPRSLSSPLSAPTNLDPEQQFHVDMANVVKRALDPYFALEEPTPGVRKIATALDYQNLARELSHKFRESEKDSH
eukprot:maker-scaffold2471_size15358-snap-gene-0.9 protein:Tk06069 transcript:maker-scaffold2471_size15358-snap-gene-0.9-mRNA-1 annotation:"hypothetical protein SORBIDRAFT_06g001870"